MSTQFYTEDKQATSRQISGQHAARQQGGGPRWFRIWSVVIGTVVAGALIALAAASLSHSHSSQAPAPAGTPTGQMNAATRAALAHFLAHGNNQMGR